MTEPEDEPIASLIEMTWWMYDDTCVGMGAERQFDYTLIGNLGQDLSPRLGRCYELAVKAFTGWTQFISQPRGVDISRPNLPAPVALIHGWWRHPANAVGIHHAWVILEDGRMWEPITGLICDPVLFMNYGSCRVDRTYIETEARINMVKHQHYGPWHV